MPGQPPLTISGGITMLRWVGMLGLVGLLASPVAVQAQDTHTIKVKSATVGSVTRIDKHEDSLEAVRVTDPDGNKVHEENKKKNFHYIYTETLLEKPEGAKRPIRLKRTYEKALSKLEEGDLILPYQGKTVLIEKKDGRYHFEYENGQALTPAAAKNLEEEWNKKNDDDPDFVNVLLPQKAVKVGDTWTLPAEAIGKGIEDKDNKVKFNHDKSNGRGKLLKVYQQDGRQYGVMHLRVELAPLSFKGDDGNDIKLQPDAKLVIELKMDGCIDGSARSAKSEISFTVNAVGMVSNEELGQLRLVLNIRGVSKADEREIK